MTSENLDFFSDEEQDILQEIMNIAFGNATADLAELIDIYVKLNVPDIQIIPTGKLPEYIKGTIVYPYEDTSMLEQKFWGNFNGTGILVFPSNAEGGLIQIFENSGPATFDTKANPTLGKEIMMEIGNILIGACVGKVADLLETIVTYSPPLVVSDYSKDYDAFIKTFDPAQAAIAMKTVFVFKQNNVNGLLLLLTNQDSVTWLRKALQDFMGQYT